MSRSIIRQPVMHAMALAVTLTLASPLVQAEVTSMLATGSYTLGSDLTVSLSDSIAFNDPVNVIDFPSSYPNSAVLHSYGSTTGNFGSRSSGLGVYDVTGSFRIEEKITNTSAIAKAATFSFFITPGLLSNNIGSPLTGTDFVSSGLSFDVRRNGSTVWGSGASLTSTASGTIFSATGDSSLYAGSGTYYSINGVSKSVDLGVINAGESITLSYELDTFAKGNSLSGDKRVVPETTYDVPGQWVTETCSGYGGYGGYGYGLVAACDPNTPTFVPGYTVTVPSYTIYNTPSGSLASSGDPFTIDLSDGTPIFKTNIPGGPPGSNSSLILSSVPEPGTYALMLGGLAVLGWSARRRRTGA
jgi:hypothetical protein